MEPGKLESRIWQTTKISFVQFINFYSQRVLFQKNTLSSFVLLSHTISSLRLKYRMRCTGMSPTSNSFRLISLIPTNLIYRQYTIDNNSYSYLSSYPIKNSSGLYAASWRILLSTSAVGLNFFFGLFFALFSFRSKNITHSVNTLI